MLLGVSMGVVCAQYLAQADPMAAGSVLMESCLPSSEFGEAFLAAIDADHG